MCVHKKERKKEKKKRISKPDNNVHEIRNQLNGFIFKYIGILLISQTFQRRKRKEKFSHLH